MDEEMMGDRYRNGLASRFAYHKQPRGYAVSIDEKKNYLSNTFRMEELS